MNYFHDEEHGNDLIGDTTLSGVEKLNEQKSVSWNDVKAQNHFKLQLSKIYADEWKSRNRKLQTNNKGYLPEHKDICVINDLSLNEDSVLDKPGILGSLQVPPKNQ